MFDFEYLLAMFWIIVLHNGVFYPVLQILLYTVLYLLNGVQFCVYVNHLLSRLWGSRFELAISKWLWTFPIDVLLISSSGVARQRSDRKWPQKATNKNKAKLSQFCNSDFLRFFPVASTILYLFIVGNITTNITQLKIVDVENSATIMYYVSYVLLYSM